MLEYLYTPFGNQHIPFLVALSKMIFLFPRWDMLVPWSLILIHFKFNTKNVQQKHEMSWIIWRLLAQSFDRQKNTPPNCARCAQKWVKQIRGPYRVSMAFCLGKGYFTLRIGPYNSQRISDFWAHLVAHQSHVSPKKYLALFFWDD